MKILQVCNTDSGGGAARVALGLHRAFLELGCDARFLVRNSHSGVPRVTECNIFTGTPWLGQCLSLPDKAIAKFPNMYGKRFVRDILSSLAHPQRVFDRMKGIEDWNYPFSYNICEPDPGWVPDVIQLHNLHPNYFDLRALPSLAKRCKVVWTLHDAWAFTGHCAYPIECESWRTGCGRCQHLYRYPAIRRDSSEINLSRKKETLLKSNVQLVTPCEWLRSMVAASVLRNLSVKVIPNGVESVFFRKESKKIARKLLSLPNDKIICLFAASSMDNPYKDFATIANAFAYVNDKAPGKTLFIGLGETPNRLPSQAGLVFPGYINSLDKLRLYYTAADVFLHATMADVTPCVIQEAYAAGTPCIATRVGGIPEMIVDRRDGFLLDKGDWKGMGVLILNLMENPGVLQKVVDNIAANPRMPSSRDQANQYLTLYSRMK